MKVVEILKKGEELKLEDRKLRDRLRPAYAVLEQFREDFPKAANYIQFGMVLDGDFVKLEMYVMHGGPLVGCELEEVVKWMHEKTIQLNQLEL